MKRSIKISIKFISILVVHSISLFSMEYENDCYFGKMPTDPLTMIFRFLPLDDLFSAGKVCQQWRKTANQSIMWKYKVFPEYRDDAKKNAIQILQSCFEPINLLQLISRLDTKEMTRRQKAFNDCADKTTKYYISRAYFKEYRLDIKNPIQNNEDEILEEIENILKYERSINLNTCLHLNNEVVNLFLAAILSDNLRLVQIFLSNGACITSGHVESSTDFPRIFSLLLEKDPSFYQIKDKFDKMIKYINDTTFVLKYHQDLLGNLKQSEVILIQKRQEFLINT